MAFIFSHNGDEEGRDELTFAEPDPWARAIAANPRRRGAAEERAGVGPPSSGPIRPRRLLLPCRPAVLALHKLVDRFA